jgi:hypothetical protein
MKWIVTLLNPTGGLYENTVEAPDFSTAQRVAKERWSYYVQWVKHTPIVETTVENPAVPEPDAE